MSDNKKQHARGDTSFRMDRAEAISNRQQRIKFRWIKEGLIRCMDSGKGNSGCSEFMIYPVKGVAPTIRSRPDHIKLLIADERIYNALRHAVLQGDSR